VKKLLGLVICTAALLAGQVYAQDTAANKDMQSLRDKMKTEKKALVAANMQLTDTEATKFWPIYDRYQNDLRPINERLGAAILAYADALKAERIPDAAAKRLLDESIAVDEAEAKLHKDYAARLIKVIPVAKAARYLQIEFKIRAAMRYEMAAGIPLVE